MLTLAELIMILVTLALFIAALYAVDALLREKTDNSHAAAVLKDFGFAYDAMQDIFITAMDARQRKYGYCRWYDETAPRYGTIADSEPLHFEYEGKKWLIALWKGQYGAFTGGGIGVYTTKNCDTAMPYDKTIYDSTEACDHLRMEFKLIKSGENLFVRKDTHWMLTGYIPGEFSEPQELTAEIKITLKSLEMRRRFTDALNRSGYGRDDYNIENNSVRFIFDEPRALNPASPHWNDTAAIQECNAELCATYTDINGNFESPLQKLVHIKTRESKLYGKILRTWRKRSF